MSGRRPRRGKSPSLSGEEDGEFGDLCSNGVSLSLYLCDLAEVELREEGEGFGVLHSVF